MKRAAAHIPHVESGSYPLRDGNQVRPLVDGEPAFRAICRAVEAAQHSVWVTVAFLKEGFEMPGGAGSLFDVLDAAADVCGAVAKGGGVLIQDGTQIR